MAFIPCVHNPYEFPKLVARFNCWKSASGTLQNGLNRYEIYDETCMNPALPSISNTYVIILRDCVLDVVLDCSNDTSTSTSSYMALKINGTVVLKSSDVTSFGNQKRATLAFSQGDVLSCEMKSDGNRVGCITEFYECRRNIEDLGMSFLRNFYYNKVFNGGYSDVFYFDQPTENRATLRKGQVVVDTTNRTVYLYADFDIILTKNTSDYWYVFKLTDFASSYLPKRDGGSAGTLQSLITDETSTVPSKSWFINLASSVCYVAVQKGQGFTLDDHYIVYNSWQY